MSEIELTCVNKVFLSGKVVGKIDYSKNQNGAETCRLTLETKEYLIVKGESKAVATKHEVLITNKIVVPSFKKHLKEGFFINVLGKLAVNNGKVQVVVTDYGHEAQFLYIPSDAASTPKTETAPAKQQSADRFGRRKLPSGEDNGDDDYFREGAAYERKAPSNAPEGFDDEIPF